MNLLTDFFFFFIVSPEGLSIWTVRVCATLRSFSSKVSSGEAGGVQGGLGLLAFKRNINFKPVLNVSTKF